jgi:DNA-directed RNA polymerase II subunit RPB1
MSPTSPAYSPTSPAYAASSPALGNSPAYGASSPMYTPTSPQYDSKGGVGAGTSGEAGSSGTGVYSPKAEPGGDDDDANQNG